jgi:tight adherence protein B
MFDNKIFALVMAAFTILLPDFIIRLIIDMRKKRYEEKYVRALKSFSAGMKAGLSIQQAIKEVMNNQFVAPEIREGFRQIDADIRVGISIEDAFDSFAEKADNDDARDVASAISLQTAVGGSEAKVVESIAQNIEDRLVTKKKIRSIFSSTDFMVNAFDIMPFLAIAFMYIGLPDLIEPVLKEPVSFIILIACLLLSLVGSVVIRKKIKNAKGE